MKLKAPTELPVLSMVAVLAIGMAFGLPQFHHQENLTIVGMNAAIFGIMACGEALVIISGGLDLSVGAILAMSSCAAAVCMRFGAPTALAAALIVGLLCGGFNGFLITRRKLPPVLTTLATLLIFRYGNSILTHSRNFNAFPDSFNRLSEGWTPALLFVLIILVGATLMNRSRAGRHLLATGGAEQSARLSGISVTSLKAKVYLISGLCAGLAGAISMAFNNATQSSVGMG